MKVTRSTHLVGMGKVNFLGDNIQSSQENRDLPSPFLSLFLHCIKLCRIVSRELVVIINQVISRLSPLTLLVYSFQLFT